MKPAASMASTSQLKTPTAKWYLSSSTHTSRIQKRNCTFTTPSKQCHVFSTQSQLGSQIVQPHQRQFLQTYDCSCLEGIFFSGFFCAIFWLNSLTAIRVLVGTKNSRPLEFYSRKSTKVPQTPTQQSHKYDHHGVAVCPSYGVGSMDPPDRMRVTSSEGVGRGGTTWSSPSPSCETQHKLVVVDALPVKLIGRMNSIMMCNHIKFCTDPNS